MPAPARNVAPLVAAAERTTPAPSGVPAGAHVAPASVETSTCFGCVVSDRAPPQATASRVSGGAASATVDRWSAAQGRSWGEMVAAFTLVTAVPGSHECVTGLLR